MQQQGAKQPAAKKSKETGTSMHVLKCEPFIAAAFGACRLLVEKAVNPRLDGVAFVQSDISWSGLQRFRFGLYAELSGEQRPRLLIADTEVDGKVTHVVCFRETKGWGDWKDNLKVYGTLDASGSTDNKYIQGTAHAGFWERAKLVPLTCIKDWLDKGDNVIYTGFSQGSAVAEAGCLQLMNNFFWKPHYSRQVLCIGFASPLVFDSVMGDEMVSHPRLFPNLDLVRGDLFHHFVYGDDIVPRVLSLVRVTRDKSEAFAKTILKLVDPLFALSPIEISVLLSSSVFQSIIGLALPDYQASGHWHFYSLDKKWEHLCAHKDSDMIELRNRMKVHAGVEAKHVQHHAPEAYFRVLGDLIHKNEAFHKPTEDLEWFSLSHNITGYGLYNTAKGNLEVYLEGDNVCWIDPDSCSVSDGSLLWKASRENWNEVHRRKVMFIAEKMRPRSSQPVTVTCESTLDVPGKFVARISCSVRPINSSDHIKVMDEERLQVFALAQAVSLSNNTGNVQAYVSELKKILLILETHFEKSFGLFSQSMQDSLILSARIATWFRICPPKDRAAEIRELEKLQANRASWEMWFFNVSECRREDLRSYVAENGLPPFTRLSAILSDLEDKNKVRPEPLKLNYMDYIYSAMPLSLFLQAASMIATDRKRSWAEFVQDIGSIPGFAIGGALSGFAQLFSVNAWVDGGIVNVLSFFSLLSSPVVAVGDMYQQRHRTVDHEFYCIRLQFAAEMCKIGRVSTTDPFDLERSLHDFVQENGGLASCNSSSSFWSDRFSDVVDLEFWLKFVQRAYRMFELRSLLMRKRFLLLSGIQKRGKTTVAFFAFGGPTRPSPKNTRDIQAWPIDDSMTCFVLDMPGTTDKSVVRQMVHRVLWECASAGLFVTDHVSVNADSSDLRDWISCASCPRVILANQADAWMRPSGDPLIPDGRAAATSELDQLKEKIRLSKGGAVVEAPVVTVDLSAIIKKQRRDTDPGIVDFVWFAACWPKYEMPRACIARSDLSTNLDATAENDQSLVLLPRSVFCLGLSLLQQSTDNALKPLLTRGEMKNAMITLFNRSYQLYSSLLGNDMLESFLLTHDIEHK
jgi:hypothetical protein